MHLNGVSLRTIETFDSPREHERITNDEGSQLSVAVDLAENLCSPLMRYSDHNGDTAFACFDGCNHALDIQSLHHQCSYFETDTSLTP